MNKLKLTIGIFSAMTLLDACTDLTVKEKDSIVVKTETGKFQGIDPTAGLDNGYKALREFGDQANFYALLEISSDELLCPTRGTDWGDNGVWRTVHQHTWDASHPYILDAWNRLNQHQYNLFQLLAPESNASASQAAEGKFLRAYNMFYLLDMFRQIPVRQVNDKNSAIPKVMDAAASFDFIVKDLTDALENLPNTGPGAAGTLYASKAAANFLLAKLYLNRHVYLGGDPQAADMTKVVQYVDAIKASGFDIESKYYFDIFLPTDDKETIFWTDASVGNRIWAGMHYNQITPDNTGGGWNGFATTADFYNLFEGDATSNAPGMAADDRRGYVPNDGKFAYGVNAGTTSYGFGNGFLVGLQYDKDGNPLTDRQGNPLSFTKDYPSGIVGNNERNGIRVLKYNPANGAYTNHEVLFRYADAHLMKIEAILRGGASSDVALTLFNDLRDSRNASTKGSITLSDVLDERGRELYIEGWRRNDQVRFGTYNKVVQLMTNTDPTRNVFPVPAVAVSSNPNLKQNPGY
jgi:hypothetical protein